MTAPTPHDALRVAIASVIDPEAMKFYHRYGNPETPIAFKTTCCISIALRKADQILEKISELKP